MDERTPAPGELVIIVAGAIMLVASFLDFGGDTSGWGSGWFPLATLLPIYGVVMAVLVALVRFAQVELPDEIAGWTLDQVLMVVGLLAGLMAVAWLLTDVGDKGIGLWVQILGGIALAVGSVMMQRARRGTSWTS
jgi:hypothetical protein